MSKSKDKNKDFIKKKKKKSFAKPIAMFAVVCLTIYAIATVISQRIDVAEKKQEMEELDAQITEAKQVQDEYARILSGKDEEETMRRIAIERLGYAYPNERRFYIVDSD